MRVLRHLPQIAWCGLTAAPGKAIKGMYWYLRGKRVRGLNLMKSAAATSGAYYRLWTRVAEPRLIAEYCGTAAVRSDCPLTAVILGAGSDRHAIELTRAALVQAFGPDLRCGILDELGYTATPPVAGDWVIAIQAGDTVNPATGRALAAAQRSNPHAKLVYWDEDRLIHGERCEPWVKGNWDELVFLSRDGLSGACAFMAPGNLELNLSVWPHQALARTAASCEAAALMHIPLVLTHRSERQHGSDTERRATQLANDELQGRDLLVRDDASLQVRWGVDHWPSVSIIIPTRDRLELLVPCIEGLDRLVYPGRVEIIVADNGSIEPATRQYLAKFQSRGGRVVDCQGEFNFAAINNRAVAEASGELVCLLNNDIEPLDGTWLEAMVRHAVRPKIGAVGAMLLYPDGTIQHAGVAVGVGGAAGHVYRGLKPEDRGNGAMHRTTRKVSIVTAACLVVRRSTYLGVGGLDERLFAVAFNDVDFCLRLAASGLSNVFVAEARLIHHESKSRGNDMHSTNFARYRRELAALQARWNTIEADDPWHSPLIRRAGEDFVLEL